MKQLLEAKDSGLNQTAGSTADNETVNASEHSKGLSWQIKWENIYKRDTSSLANYLIVPLPRWASRNKPDTTESFNRWKSPQWQREDNTQTTHSSWLVALKGFLELRVDRTKVCRVVLWEKTTERDDSNHPESFGLLITWKLFCGPGLLKINKKQCNVTQIPEVKRGNSLLELSASYRQPKNYKLLSYHFIYSVCV